MAKITKARGCAGLKSATFKAKRFVGRPLAPAALPKPHGDLPTRCKVRFSGFVGGGGRGENRFSVYTPSLRIWELSTPSTLFQLTLVHDDHLHRIIR